MKNRSFGLTTLRLAFLASLLLAFIGPSSKADAKPAVTCRDCPFPFRVSEGHWMMPNEKIEIQIQEEDLDRRTVMVHVWLRDAKTGEILATGSAKH